MEICVMLDSNTHLSLLSHSSPVIIYVRFWVFIWVNLGILRTADFLPNEVLLRISYSLISTCVVVVCDSRGPAILQTVMASSEPITVAYWATRGLGAPLRMMVMYANHPLNCVLYDYDVKDGSFDGSLWTNAKQALKEKTPIINLPYVNVKDMWVCQSIACSTYIGRKLSMNGKNDDEISYCEQMLNEVFIFQTLSQGQTSATVHLSAAVMQTSF